MHLLFCAINRTETQSLIFYTSELSISVNKNKAKQNKTTNQNHNKIYKLNTH